MYPWGVVFRKWRRNRSRMIYVDGPLDGVTGHSRTKELACTITEETRLDDDITFIFRRLYKIQWRCKYKRTKERQGGRRVYECIKAEPLRIVARREITAAEYEESGRLTMRGEGHAISERQKRLFSLLV